jgi:DNA-binding MarR family transcriptional regulator
MQQAGASMRPAADAAQSKGLRMTFDQFHALAALARLQENSKAYKGAWLFFMHKITQVEAAKQAGCRQSTVSAAVRKIRAAQRLANHGADRH